MFQNMYLVLFEFSCHIFVESKYLRRGVIDKHSKIGINLFELGGNINFKQAFNPTKASHSGMNLCSTFRRLENALSIIY